MIINYTPHKIMVYSPDSKKVIREIEPSGLVARMSEEVVEIGEFESIPIVKTTFGEVYLADEHGRRVNDFPDFEQGRLLIVSDQIATVLNRPDVVAPDTGIDSAVYGRGGGQTMWVIRFRR